MYIFSDIVKKYISEDILALEGNADLSLKTNESHKLNLKINKLSIDTSEVIVEGEIISITYSEKEFDKKNSSLLGKIFK